RSVNLTAMRLSPRAFAIPRRTRDRVTNPVAVSPVSWGGNETRGWGRELAAGRVLAEIATLGEPAIEAGPSGFLPDRSQAARSPLRRHPLKIVAGGRRRAARLLS